MKQITQTKKQIQNYLKQVKTFQLIILFLLASLPIKAQEKVGFPPVPPHPYLFDMKKETEEEFLDDIDAELRLKLQEIKEFNKEEYWRLLTELHFSKLRHPFMNDKDESPENLKKEILEYEIDTKVLVAKIKKANSSDKVKLKTELKNSVSKLFDLKEELRKKEIKQLENRLAELNKKLKVKSKMKNEIVKRRVQELLGESDYLNWD